MPALVAAGCTIEVLKSAAELDVLAGPWSALVAQQRSCSPALHLDWIRTWWEVYGSAYGRADAGLRVITLRRGDSLIGALPLYERSGLYFAPRWLGFVSTGERESEETCPEYLDLLRLPGEEETCL